MTSVKQQALKAIKSMPAESTIDDIFERLHFIAQVEAGIRDADDGRILTHDDVKKRVVNWL